MKKPLFEVLRVMGGINVPKWRCPYCKLKRFQTKRLCEQHLRRFH